MTFYISLFLTLSLGPVSVAFYLLSFCILWESLSLSLSHSKFSFSIFLTLALYHSFFMAVSFSLFSPYLSYSLILSLFTFSLVFAFPDISQSRVGTSSCPLSQMYGILSLSDSLSPPLSLSNSRGWCFSLTFSFKDWPSPTLSNVLQSLFSYNTPLFVNVTASN